MFLAHSVSGQPTEEITSLLLVGDTVLALWFLEKRGKAKAGMRKASLWVLGALVVVGLVAAFTTKLWLPKKKVATSTTARIAIRSPQSGQVVTGKTVHVKVELLGGKVLDNKVVSAPGGGHIHISIDGTLLTQSYQLEQDLDVKPGLHTVTAEYVRADHRAFQPPVQAAVVFTDRG
jgi:hypothetical protein